jgi:hypothetical protein
MRKTKKDESNLSALLCDGDCPEHQGEVRKVNVTHPDPFYDWGEFNYCEVAIEKDEADGFEVVFT